MLSLRILHMILSPSPTDEPTSYYVQLNVNDIFLAIAKKLPKDGEGGAAGAGGIRWELTKFQKSQVHLISSDFQGYRRRRRCSKELLLQQITLMWLPNSALKLFRKKNAKKRFWITLMAGVRLQVTLRSLWLFTCTIQWSKSDSSNSNWLGQKVGCMQDCKRPLHWFVHTLLLLSRPQSFGLAVCIFNKYHIIDELYNLALEAQGTLGLHFDLGGIWAFSRPMPFVQR